MEIMLTEQVKIFLFSVIFGGVLSLFYDILKVFADAVNANKKQVFLKDVLYFIICGLLTFVFILAINLGVIRSYILLGIAIGWVVCKLTLGNFVVRALNFFIRVLKRIFKKIKLLIFSPIYKIFNKIILSVINIFKRFFKCIKKFLYKPKNNLQKSNRVVYNLFTKSKYNNLKGSRINSESFKKKKK